MKRYLTERGVIGSVDYEIEISVEIDLTNHAEERRHRHRVPIEDRDILETVDVALPKLTSLVVNDNIDIDDELVIRDRVTDLNVVGVLKRTRTPNRLTFRVITVMRKANFKPKRGTKAIDLNESITTLYEDEDPGDTPPIPPEEEAEYNGRTVTLNNPFYDTDNSSHKFAVYVRNPDTGNVNKVSFGDPDMSIKRDDFGKRKSFRARHKCNDKDDITAPGYWSCVFWRDDISVSDLVEQNNQRLPIRKKSVLVREVIREMVYEEMYGK